MTSTTEDVPFLDLPVPQARPAVVGGSPVAVVDKESILRIREWAKAVSVLLQEVITRLETLEP